MIEINTSTIIEVKLVEYLNNFSDYHHMSKINRVFPKVGDMVIVAVEAASYNNVPAVAYGKVISIKDGILAINPLMKIGDWYPHSKNADVLWVTEFEVVEIVNLN